LFLPLAWHSGFVCRQPFGLGHPPGTSEPLRCESLNHDCFDHRRR
jgi:hypothetical protein